MNGEYLKNVYTFINIDINIIVVHKKKKKQTFCVDILCFIILISVKISTLKQYISRYYTPITVDHFYALA